MTQEEIILSLLEPGNWVCTDQMYAEYMRDPRSRISSLKKKGYILEDRLCEDPTHHHKQKHTKQWLWIRFNLNGQPIRKEN